jgi:hypothetical protein
MPSPHFKLPPDKFVRKIKKDYISRAAHVPYGVNGEK